MELHYDMCSLV